MLTNISYVDIVKLGKGASNLMLWESPPPSYSGQKTNKPRYVHMCGITQCFPDV
jgi:hypothetical protein